MVKRWDLETDLDPTPRFMVDAGDYDALAARLAEAEAQERDVQELQDVLRRNGFVKCDIAACNCGSWHARYGWPERFHEIDDATRNEERNGEPLLARVNRIVARLAEEESAHRVTAGIFASTLVRADAAEARIKPLEETVAAQYAHNVLLEVRLQKVMARCADLLDEDQFNELDAMVGGICDAWVIAPAQKTLTDLARETNYQPSRYEAHLEARLADAEALLRDARSSIPGNAKFTLRRIDDFLRAGVTTVTVSESDISTTAKGG